MSYAKLICNPIAGRGRAAQLLPEIRNKLQSLGIGSEAVFTQSPGDGIRLASEARQAGFSLVIAIGGDGTINEVANGLLLAAHDQVAGRLGIIPVGTGNDFFKMLSEKGDWQAACERIAQGKYRRIDVARVNDRYFINNVGVGFDAQVGIDAQKIRWLRGQAVYLAALAYNMLYTYRTPQVQIQLDGRLFDQPITLCTIGNGRCSGGSFWLTPHAQIDDGLLDVCLVDGLSKARMLGLVPRVMAGTHIRDRAVKVIHAQQVTITSEDPLPVHADGEILYTAAHKLEMQLLPAKLDVIG